MPDIVRKADRPVYRGKLRFIALLVIPACCALVLPVTDSIAGGKVQLSSSPAGATVCKKVLDREDCFGKTPLFIEVEADSSTKLIFRKLGYKARELYVEPNTGKVSIALEKRDLLFDPGKHADSNVRIIQQNVNDQLSKLIYQVQFEGEKYFDLVGQRTVFKGGEGTVLAFPVLINSPEALRKLKQAGRARDPQKRYAGTVDVLDDIGVFSLFEAVMKSVSMLPLDKIAFNVLYSKSVAVLDVDQIENINRRYTGSYYTEYGSVRHRVDKYETYTTRQNVTVVRDKAVSIDYTFVIGKNVGRFAGQGRFLDLLDKIDIITNDTPDNQYQRIEIKN